MKRSVSDSSNSVPLKRVNSSVSEYDDDEDDQTHYFLRSQNRALAIELGKYKRQILQSRKELDMMRGKSREMEKLTSAIQRAWSQLDIDASMLLDSLGDAEVPDSANDSSELLLRILQVGSKHGQRDPTDTTDLPQMDIDEWSSVETIEQERKKAEQALNAEFGGTVDESLTQHTSFTLSLLERLCTAIGEAGTFTEAPEVINAVAEAKALHEERLLLADRISKLSAENVNFCAQMHSIERQRAQMERELVRMQVAQEEAVKKNAMAAEAGTTLPAIKEEAGLPSTKMETDGDSNGTDPDAAANTSADMVNKAEVDEKYKQMEKELTRKVEILEKQLAQSESDKAKAEMDLTARLAQPMNQSEATVTHLKKVIEDLRQQLKSRLTSHQTEIIGLREKISNLEIGMEVLEKTSLQKMQVLTAASAEKVSAARSEVDSLQAGMVSQKAELALNKQLKQHVEEFQALEASRQDEMNKLKNHIRALSRNQDMLRIHLKKSREREERLETEYIKTFREKPTSLEGKEALGEVGLEEVDVKEIIAEGKNERKAAAKAVPARGRKKKKVVEEGEEAEGEESKETPATKSSTTIEAHVDSSVLSLTASERAKNMELELNDSQAYVNDLIVEIDAVTAEGEKSREQASRLLALATEGQNSHKGVIEENMRMQDQMKEMQRQYEDMKTMYESSSIVLKEREGILTQFRGAEQKFRTELTMEKNITTSLQTKNRECEQDLAGALQKKETAELNSEATAKRNTDLYDRCKQMAGKLESERKTRMVAQREARIAKDVAKGSGVAPADGVTSSSSISDQDQAMLSLTLDMLRCSVCKDRFKEVAITRCYHMFCRECIDINLANRHRKCPACGEKFGYDDVKTVYFNH